MESVSYALISNDVVINVVMWNGEGNLFDEYNVVDNTVLDASPGDYYIDDVLYPYPRDDQQYVFNKDEKEWLPVVP
ncbi:TPA: hypothetical protein KFU04_002015 [Escherichia coli]|nr:hypothetical protein [Escherichia coli]